MALLSPPQIDDLVIEDVGPYLLSRWILVGEQPEDIPGFVFKVTDAKKQVNNMKYQLIYYCQVPTWQQKWQHFYDKIEAKLKLFLQ